MNHRRRMGGHPLSHRELWASSPYQEGNLLYLQNEGVEPSAHSSPTERKHPNSLEVRKRVQKG